MLHLDEVSYTFKVASHELGRFAIRHLIYGETIDEDRARTAASQLSTIGVDLHCVTLVDEAILHVVPWTDSFNLHETADLESLVARMTGVVAIDLTSLEHRVWAPLVRTLLRAGRALVALYAEPQDYRKHDQEPGSLYDLSSNRGIEPLPGFARIGRRADDRGTFAPLLGFEGARLQHIFDQEEVDSRVTSPVVGIPAFRLEYSMQSYIANKETLDRDRMEDRVEFAAAHCPFEAYQALERIHHSAGSRYLRVAPIGTKPHALGAVLYAIDHMDAVELIYDHPVRTANRTVGSRSMYVYDVSGFMAHHRRWRADA
ncbi:hypothetical protein MRBLWO14_002471 [Microbacterium sp. LWO14-1.2]|uniref:hypothetical protein n=1 Tax=unclassified Microbacterium TaxID=2609290 RepID=UPI00313A4B72